MLFWLGLIAIIWVTLFIIGLARNSRSFGRVPTQEEIAEFDAELQSKGLPLISEPMVPSRVPYLRVVA